MVFTRRARTEVERWPMITTIFRRETNSADEWLTLDADAMLTYHIENSGWSMTRSNSIHRENRMTPHEAKLRWPSFAEIIDAALVQLTSAS